MRVSSVLAQVKDPGFREPLVEYGRVKPFSLNNWGRELISLVVHRFLFQWDSAEDSRWWHRGVGIRIHQRCLDLSMRGVTIDKFLGRGFLWLWLSTKTVLSHFEIVDSWRRQKSTSLLLDSADVGMICVFSLADVWIRVFVREIDYRRSRLFAQNYPWVLAGFRFGVYFGILVLAKIREEQYTVLNRRRIIRQYMREKRSDAFSC